MILSQQQLLVGELSSDELLEEERAEDRLRDDEAEERSSLRRLRGQEPHELERRRTEAPDDDGWAYND